MSGIVGYVGSGPTVPFLLDGLKRLEYKGYDSAGIGVVRSIDGRFEMWAKKLAGRVSDLEKGLFEAECDGSTGIAHLRWATHGRPSDINAHPHLDCTGRIAVVHDGIVENAVQLREELSSEGHRFSSETDTEVIPHLIESFYDGKNLLSAVQQAVSRLKGAVGLVVMSADEPGVLVGVRLASPLIVGLGEGENYIASDLPALLSRTKNAIVLEDGEMAVITASEARIMDSKGNSVWRKPYRIKWDAAVAEKGKFPHFMLKEIHEQPQVFEDNLKGRIALGEDRKERITLDGVRMTAEYARSIRKIFMVACGTAYHACLTGKHLIESLARIPVEVDPASEFRYRDPIYEAYDGKVLTVAVSQSGETADTLQAIREAKRRESRVLAITNAAGSSVAREADDLILTKAGPEIAIASTKAYTAQIEALALLALYLAKDREGMAEGLLSSLKTLSSRAKEALSLEPAIKAIAYEISGFHDVFFIGRGPDYASALEGQLSLKETSYIHAEAYAAGELKHGPLALITDNVPVIAICSQPHLLEKTISNITEVKARGGWVAALAAMPLAKQLEPHVDRLVALPEVHPLLMPIITAIPLQLLAYHASIARGCDVDTPRNLAKSVTVE